MSQENNNWDCNRVVFVYGDFAIESGWAPDSVITLKANADTFRLKVGAGGSTSRSRTNNKSGQLTLRLMADAAANTVLAAGLLLDEQTPGGAGAKPLLLKDLDGNLLAECSKGWIMRQPDIEIANETPEREWTFEGADWTVFAGGH